MMPDLQVGATVPKFARDLIAASPRIGTRALAPGDYTHPDIVVPPRTSSQNTQSEMISPVESKSTLSAQPVTTRERV